MNPYAPVTRALDIVVPIRNEVDSIDEFHARVERLGLADALIFVDNASTDGTLERLAACPRVRVIRHATDEGWGASMRDGIAASDGELIVIIDADLEYPPEAIPRLTPLVNDPSQTVADKANRAVERLRRTGGAKASR